MEKYINKYTFMREADEIKGGHYFICIEIGKYENIVEKLGVIKSDILIYEIIGFINKLYKEIGSMKLCRYESDLIIIQVKSDDEKLIIDTINKIVFNKYSTEFEFRAGYKRISETMRNDSFFDNIKKVIKSEKFRVVDVVDERHELSKDIVKNSLIKRDILANDNSNLKLLYQPKIDINTNEIVGCEISIIWEHEEIGRSKLKEFISIIETLEKVKEFDLMVFEKACKEMQELNGIIDNFSVNLFTNSISSENFVDEFEKIRKANNIDTDKIIIQISEESNRDYTETFLLNLNELNDLGYRVSVADFGNKYSSYSKLAIIKFDELKMPKEFLGLGYDKKDTKNRIILKGIIMTCKMFECVTVLEDVESEDELNTAKELGVNYVQGGYYSPPVDKKSIETFVREYNIK